MNRSATWAWRFFIAGNIELLMLEVMEIHHPGPTFMKVAHCLLGLTFLIAAGWFGSEWLRHNPKIGPEKGTP